MSDFIHAAQAAIAADPFFYGLGSLAVLAGSVVTLLCCFPDVEPRRKRRARR